tara:strand:+ start:2969 stop:4258 length:1290 start_codon:yes stop_codon:yes gene_type:complete
MQKENKFIFYSLGHFGFTLLGFTMATWMLKHYMPTLEESTWLIPASFVTLVTVIPRITDAINDPLIANWSDRTNTKWGRRYPFMLLSIIPLILTFNLIWSNPSTTIHSEQNAWWWFGMQVLFFIFSTCYVVPYLSLMPEISKPGEERLKISTYQGIARLFGMLACPILIKVFQPEYGLPGSIKIISIIAMIFLIAPFASPFKKKKAETTEDKPQLFNSMRGAMKSKPFVIFLSTHFIYLISVMVALTTITYVPANMGIAEDMQISFSAVLHSITIVTAIFTTKIYWLNKKVKEKIKLKKSFIISLLVFALPMSITTFSQSETIAIVLMFFSGIGLSGLFVVPYAFLADIVQLEKIKTKENKECIFYGIQGLVLKSCYGLGPFVVLYLQSLYPDQGLKMIGVFIIVFSMISTAIFLKYPEKEIKEIIKNT